MESITKNRQSPAALQAMIERAYGPAEVPSGDGWFTEMGDGWFSVVYLITLRSGTRVVLKVAPPAGVEVMTYEIGAMATELEALRLLRGHVPVPAVHFADRSHDLCDADWFFMDFVDAPHFGTVRGTLSAAEQDTVGAAIGALNRRINGIRGPAFGPLSGPGDPTWRAAFTRMIGAVLDDGERRSVPLGIGYDEVRALIAAHAGSLDEVTEPCLVEWDLWSTNVLVRDGAVVAIIDHERAFFGDPLMEAGFTATDLPAYGESSAFVRGYGRSPVTPAERTRRRLYTLHLTLIMTIEPTFRQFDDPESYAWARARLHEALALLTAPAPAEW
ncbi:phosphotransferase family protein [Actinoplanes couchii]|uniref:Aminoglycoside phosphotransferase n=1 Tax=Actinoplanes couchii TaxID=403638 RepID=A0ABQ3X1V1_9ACTN|nr:phosphotransferase [Actinoplanes couchii]MDR6316885.1 aminoglycoside phosphotransferase (APT) family kinase protein [Actinoplanes couchii]GID52492.1 aminoglycoside phosphotransferase [Actinoplanes couchii]